MESNTQKGRPDDASVRLDLLVEAICRRPRMYVLDGSFAAVVAYPRHPRLDTRPDRSSLTDRARTGARQGS